MLAGLVNVARNLDNATLTNFLSLFTGVIDQEFGHNEFCVSGELVPAVTTFSTES